MAVFVLTIFSRENLDGNLCMSFSKVIGRHNFLAVRHFKTSDISQTFLIDKLFYRTFLDSYLQVKCYNLVFRTTETIQHNSIADLFHLH